jgi:lipopolysaccharide/colanic/teichoic acid biosynthesis glycosyltransferase
MRARRMRVPMPAEDGEARRIGAASEAAKRCLDIALSLVGLILLSPVFLLIAALVRLSSPGPTFFRQERVGRGGRPFRLLKFRSMRPSSGGPEVTAGSDDRITPIGRLLRKAKLDELPQLLNVLLGDMSLVGPRPEVERYVRHYTDAQREVLSVQPGVTGVSQLLFRHEEELLAGHDDVEDFYIREVMPRKLDLDLRYVRERSFTGDLGILARTFVALFR